MALAVMAAEVMMEGPTVVVKMAVEMKAAAITVVSRVEVAMVAVDEAATVVVEGAR